MSTRVESERENERGTLRKKGQTSSLIYYDQTLTTLRLALDRALSLGDIIVLRALSFSNVVVLAISCFVSGSRLVRRKPK